GAERRLAQQGIFDFQSITGCLDRYHTKTAQDPRAIGTDRESIADTVTRGSMLGEHLKRIVAHDEPIGDAHGDTRAIPAEHDAWFLIREPQDRIHLFRRYIP